MYKHSYVCGKCGTVCGYYRSGITQASDHTSNYRFLFPNSGSLQLKMSSKVKNSGFIRRNIKWTAYPYNEKILKQKYEELKNICKNYKNKWLFNDKVIEMTLSKYKVISKYGKYRVPINIGIMAKCLYYSWKEFYVFVSVNECKEIFGITKKTLSKSNNNLNKLTVVHKEVKKILNKKPIDIMFMLKSFSYKTNMKKKEFRFLKNIIKRLINTYISIINTPKAVISGILNNFIKRYKNLSFNKKDIYQYMGVSSSSVQEYTPKTEYLFEFIDY
jgi:hypothetical protein